MSHDNKHTVGLLGSNGRVGSAILAALLEPERLDKINLIVFHRPDSTLSAMLPSTVEVREVDIEGDVDAILAAIGGIETFVSAVGQTAVPHQINLVEALAKSPDAVTFIPSAYVNEWTEEQVANYPQMHETHARNSAAGVRAETLGLGVTRVYAGLFAEFFFGYNFCQVDVKSNTAKLNAAQRRNKNPLTSLPYLGTGIADLVTRSPNSIKDKAFSFIEYWSTGQDYIDVLTKVSHSAPVVADYTAEDEQALKEQAPLGIVAAAVKSAWAANNWDYQGQTKVAGLKGKTLEEFAASFV